MKIQNTFLCTAILLLSLHSSAAVGDLPLSTNPLVNQITDLVMNLAPSASLAQLNHQLNSQLAQAVAAPGATAEAFANFTEALRQISKETLELEKLALTERVENVGQFSATDNVGRFYVNIRDLRLFHVANSSNPLQSQIAVVLSQVHLLSQAEFEAFSKSFLDQLSEAIGDIQRLNRLKNLKPGGERGEPVGFSYGSLMLYRLFEDPDFFKRQGLASQNAELAALQDWRISELVSRSLNYYSIFKDQEVRIVEIADRRLPRVRGDLQSGPIATILNSWSWRSGRKCPTLFESVTPKVSRRSQWP